MFSLSIFSGETPKYPPPSLENEKAIGTSGGGMGTAMEGDEGVLGVGGVLCARACALANSTTAKSISRFLILMDRKPPDRNFSISRLGCRKVPKTEGRKQKAEGRQKTQIFTAFRLLPTAFCFYAVR
jgi:hypothetical protein